LLTTMVYVLGVLLQDQKLAKRALTAFYGIGPSISAKLCARLQIHDKCKIRQLTPAQITGLASFLSSPATSPPVPRHPLAAPTFIPPSPATPLSQLKAATKLKTQGKSADTAVTFASTVKSDPLRRIKVESELRREVRENIAHQRMIGSYRGKRHAMGLPVRGQNTQSNAKTARRLNRVERFG